MAELNQCTYVEWFRFKQCTIRSCKNWTIITQSRCMAIDRVQPAGAKIITDAELHMYKYPTQKVSTRLVAMKRKKALLRVKSVLILKEYVSHLYLKYLDTRQRPVRNRHTEKAEKSFPLRIRQLRFDNWMWPHIVSQEEYKEFLQTRRGECSSFSLQDLLQMTEMKFSALAASIN